MALIVSNIRLRLGAEPAALAEAAAKACGVPADAVRAARVLRRSLDARNKRDIHFLVQAEAVLDARDETRVLARRPPNVAAAEPPARRELAVGTERLRGRAIVCGAGPAGLFAAYRLAQYGFSPLVVERGRAVEPRVRDVTAYWAGGPLNFTSNVMFGEGGAGTFSDGKLTSRSRDPHGAEVLELLHRFGAPGEILIDAKPHIGTDRLRAVVPALRREITRLGGEVRFETKLAGVEIANGALSAVTLVHGGEPERVECGALVLAIGQGARDTVRMLAGAGVAVEKKPFAAGVRVEHPQPLIDRAQYGDFAGHPALGAAEYRLTGKSGARGVYTFCMCPGGAVIASASGPEQVVTNGMSNCARDGINANAAVVVQVNPEDMPPGPLGGIVFCEEIEKRAFLAAGGTGYAPASTVGDFLAGRKPRSLGNVAATYRPGVVPCDLKDALPAFVAQGVADGLCAFSRQLIGFDLPDAVLTAVESRTSAPYRILRGENGQSVTAAGLYPVGEGAGYAGGIVSSAIDGLIAAERVVLRARP